jgi:uncharacterized membrane protein YjfL (UPF0719 family)
MIETSDFFYWDHSNDKVILLNIILTIGIFASLRLFLSSISNIQTLQKIKKKDNFAFGISLSGAVFAVTIVLMGVIYGDMVYSLEGSLIAIGLYGVLGILLMALTRIIFDTFSLPNISIRDEIGKGNVAAGIVDAGNVIAAAIVIRTIMMWVSTSTMTGVLTVVTGYFISQIILTAATYLRLKVFTKYNDGESMQKAFAKGNSALALRFAGRKIGSAFAITAATNIMAYDAYEVYKLFLVWAVISAIAIFVLRVVSTIADKIILHGFDVNNEVIKKNNITIGAVQSVIYISLGMLLAELVF